MAVGLDELTQLTPVNGIQLGSCQAGIKYPGRHDLTLIEISKNAHVASVFTQNKFCAAPVILAKQHIAQTTPRYLVINTGNANAGTGIQGMSDATLSCETIAELANVPVASVLPFSTGVIGENLPMDKMLSGLPKALKACQPDNWVLAANAIMTTDTMPKGFSKTFECGGETVVITGIAKGSGMIRPNMATLLAFIATDAKIEQSLLKKLLNNVNNLSFNSITVDSDTSTNDACILIATGKGGLQLDANTDSKTLNIFIAQLQEIMHLLAQGLVRDAEGASKFIAVTVKNGLNEIECREVAYTVAHSPLVKTAFFASDPNWGRILASIGRANVDDLNVNQLNIFLNDVCIVENGARSEKYSEAQGQAVMDQEDIEIVIDLSRGKITHTIWTSDLSYDYIKINAEYRS